MELHQALAERVNRKLAGQGVPAAAVDAAVAQVVAALAGHGELVAALSARSTPDLATRVRRALEREGVVLDRVGLATAGAHTVVTLRVPATDAEPLRRVADQLALALTFLPSDDEPVSA